MNTFSYSYHVICHLSGSPSEEKKWKIMGEFAGNKPCLNIDKTIKKKIFKQAYLFLSI